jgi:hypothetical protein
MKTLVRDSQTGVYYQGIANWTSDPHDAFDFRIAERAVRFVRDAGLEKVEMVFAFEDPQYNVPIPIDERFGFKGGYASRRHRR